MHRKLPQNVMHSSKIFFNQEYSKLAVSAVCAFMHAYIHTYIHTYIQYIPRLTQV